MEKFGEFVKFVRNLKVAVEVRRKRGSIFSLHFLCVNESDTRREARNRMYDEE